MTKRYTVSSELRRVIVIEVDREKKQAICQHLDTGSTFPAAINMTHGYDRPRPGDAWIMTRWRDMWVFDYLIEGQSDHAKIGSAAEMVHELLGDRWSPHGVNMDGAPEVPVWPVIGERRIFKDTALPMGFSLNRWVRADGSLHQIHRYPQLFAIYGTTYGGDGTTTFGVPNILSPDVLGDSPRGIVAVGTVATNPVTVSTTAAPGTLLTGTLTYTPLSGRRYRAWLMMRAIQPASATNSSAIAYFTQATDTSNYIPGTNDWHIQAMHSTGYTHANLQWVFAGDGVSHGFQARIYRGAVDLTAYPTQFYIEDVGSVTPASETSHWYILAE